MTPAPDTTKGDALFADAEALAQRNEWDLCVHTVTRAMSVGCTDTAQAHFLHGIALGCDFRPISDTCRLISTLVNSIQAPFALMFSVESAQRDRAAGGGSGGSTEMHRVKPRA